MGNWAEFDLKERLLLRAYPWRRIKPTPWTPLSRPLSECRLALISSAGFVLADQPPFDSQKRGGDASFREIPSETSASELIETHRSQSFDHAGIRRDANLGMPVDRVREMVQRNRVGSLATDHISVMGSITAPGRLIRQTAPEIARRLAQDHVDVALLVPV